MSCNDDFTCNNNSFMHNERINNYLKLCITKTRNYISNFRI